MKKITTALLFGGITTGLMASAYAQDLTSKKGETMLPEEGDYALGFDADPFLDYVGNFLNSGTTHTEGNGVFSGTNSAIVGRMFKDAQTAYRGRVRLGYGSSGSIYGDPFDVQSSSYGYVAAVVPVKVNEHLWFNVRLEDYYFDDAPWSRDGSDDMIHGYQLDGGSNIRFGETTRLDTRASVFYGGLSSLNLGDISEGIAQTDRTIFRLRSRLSYRADGQSAGDNGWSFNTTYRGRLYNQEGIDFYDTHQFQISQGANLRIHDGLTWFNEVAYREKNWDSALDEYDSDGIRLSTGIHGHSNGLNYRAGVTFENRDYDDSSLGDQDVVGFDGLIYGSHNDWDWTFFLNYGIQDRNITNKFQFILADATGVRCGGTVARQFSDHLKGTFWVQGLFLDAELDSPGGFDTEYISTGITMERQLNPCASLGATVSVHRIEYDGSGSSTSDTSANFNVFYSHEF